MWVTIASMMMEEGRAGLVDGKERGKMPGCIEVDDGKQWGVSIVNSHVISGERGGGAQTAVHMEPC